MIILFMNDLSYMTILVHLKTENNELYNKNKKSIKHLYN